MKKSLLFFASTALFFAACSSNDTFKEVNEDVAIGFSNNYVGKATKAEITTANITGSSFGVYGYKYREGATNPATVQLFSNEQVTYTNNDWTHANVRYWDKSVVAADLSDDTDYNGYYFYAYVPYNASASFARTGSTNGFTYPLQAVFADAANDAVDLCVARAENITFTTCNTYDNTITTHNAAHVAFIFNHVLSKLAFKVKTEGFDSDYIVTIKKLNIAFPTATSIKWTQTAKGADAGTISYDNNQNTSTLTQPADLTNKQSVFDGSQVVSTAANNTAAVLSGAKNYIVTPNVSSSQNHTMQLEVIYELNYNDANSTTEQQIATGTAEINFVQNYFYYLVVNIKPTEIRFDVDRVEGFTPADADSGPFDVL